MTARATFHDYIMIQVRIGEHKISCYLHFAAHFTMEQKEHEIKNLYKNYLCLLYYLIEHYLLIIQSLIIYEGEEKQVKW